MAAAILADCPDYVELARATRAGLTSPALAGWMVWPLPDAVATAAVDSGDARCFDDGLALLSALTPRLTSEFALRIFLNADLDRTLAVVRTWTDHGGDAVRRLASEGTRPKLPWARQVKGLITDPTLTRPILDALHLDESAFVRRSVAKHLNDVSRLNPAAAVSTAESWAKRPGPHTASTIRHAMRSLIKAGDARALALLGFTATLADLQVSGPAVDRRSISLGEAITFTANVTNTSARTATLVIDYIVHHRKANGTRPLRCSNSQPGASNPVAPSP